MKIKDKNIAGLIAVLFFFAPHSLIYTNQKIHVSTNCSTPYFQNIMAIGADTITVRPDFGKYFKNCSVDGSIAIYDQKAGSWIVSDTNAVYKETLPASTFKIINLLIALETGVVRNEKDTIKWVGKTDTSKYGDRTDTYRDFTVEDAFKESVVWVFIELAKRIGREKYKFYLAACNYGNQNLSTPDDDFWNFGNFGISPMDQVNFLRRIYEGKVPFSRQNIEILKKVSLTEKGNTFSIYAKTGWTRAGGINTGWWVGWIETTYRIYFFATRLIQDRKYNRSDFGTCRKEITKSIFRELGIME